MSKSTKNDYLAKIEVIKRLSAEQLRAAVKLIHGDGHTIFVPAAFVSKCGWTEQDVEAFTETNKSDFSDSKSTITARNGEPVKELRGVYGLDMLKAIASILGVEYVGALGRGFEARNITDALLKHWNSQKTRAEALEI